MQTGKVYQKRVGVTRRCAWCGLIKVGGAWTQERRRKACGPYTHGICEHCREQFLAEAGRRL
jgi:hypothetical protein